MQVTELSQDGLSRQLRVTVPAATINDMLTARLREVGKTVRLPGFRPGKVPMTILKQRYGRSVLGEVVETAVEQTSQQAVTDQGLRTVGQPKIELESFEDGQELAYKMSFEVLPEFELIDFSSLEIERIVPEVADQEIDETISRVAEGRRTYTALEAARPAQDGDQIVIDFAGTVDGETQDGLSGEDHPLVLGSGHFIPGFEEQLIGAEAPEHRSVTVTFPDAYPVADLAGKQAVFEVDVKEIRAPDAVAVDDAFARDLGLDDLAALRETVRAQLNARYGQAARQIVKRNVLDALADRYDFEAPPGLVGQEFEAIWKQVEEAREKNELSAEEAAKPAEELEAEYRSIAERRVRLGLVLAEVGRRNGIEVSQDELARAVQAQAQRYGERANELLKLLRERPAAVESIRAPLLEEKVIDYILELAKVTDRTVSPDALYEETSGDTAQAPDEAQAETTAATEEAPAPAETAPDADQDGETLPRSAD